MVNRVKPNDLAMLVHPLFPENMGRICTVEYQLPNVEVFKDKGVVWYCTFPSDIKTSAGILPCATIQDWRLLKIAGPDIDISVTEASDEPVCLPA